MPDSELIHFWRWSNQFRFDFWWKFDIRTKQTKYQITKYDEIHKIQFQLTRMDDERMIWTENVKRFATHCRLVTPYARTSHTQRMLNWEKSRAQRTDVALECGTQTSVKIQTISILNGFAVVGLDYNFGANQRRWEMFWKIKMLKTSNFSYGFGEYE